MENNIIPESITEITEPVLADEITADTDEPIEVAENIEAADRTDDSEMTDESPTDSDEYLTRLIREERISNEYTEFKALFPGVSVSELPDPVLESVRNGVPLSAAYALYERRREMSASVASDVNKKNRELSFAVKNGKKSEEYFSPAEVRQMSPSEVRANYSKIIDSMSHWN